jgi:hypothetical protein
MCDVNRSLLAIANHGSRLEENAMTNTVSRRAMLALALAMSTASFAASPEYFPTRQHLVQPDSRTHRADIGSRQMARPPQMPVHHEDPFADMLLG